MDKKDFVLVEPDHYEAARSLAGSFSIPEGMVIVDGGCRKPDMLNLNPSVRRYLLPAGRIKADRKEAYDAVLRDRAFRKEKACRVR